jgi:hypothetical protein
MRHVRIVFLLGLVSFALGAAAQETAPAVQLTQVPPKPTCTVILRNGACADLWNAYNRALAQRQREELQLYITRQRDLASQAATAPLQQQISDLNKLTADQQAKIGSMQKQMETDAAAALEARQTDTAAAHQQGMVRGAELGGGGALALLALIFVVMRLTKSKP